MDKSVFKKDFTETMSSTRMIIKATKMCRHVLLNENLFIDICFIVFKSYGEGTFCCGTNNMIQKVFFLAKFE